MSSVTASKACAAMNSTVSASGTADHDVKMISPAASRAASDMGGFPESGWQDVKQMRLVAQASIAQRNWCIGPADLSCF